jgi:hypothetical protein
MRKFSLAIIAIAFFFSSNSQGIKTPAPSPPATIKQDFGISSIELSYSRPGVKGRQIFGDLVPYGKVWRTGANNATTITFGSDVTIADTKIPAGKYGLLTIPGENEWTVIITKQLDVTSPAQYKQDQDVVRVPVEPYMLPFSIETFTIGFNNITSTSCNLELMWDSVYVYVPIHTEIDGSIMAQIKEVMATDNRPYFQAAMYYLDNGKDLNQALQWFDKAIEQNPDGFFIYYQKARTLVKLGKRQDAIAASNKSIDLAKKAKNDDYVRLNEKLLAQLK